jgi:hypothetical protein
MTLDPTYPATLFEPPPLPDLSTKAERERLTPSASKVFFNIVEKWNLRDGDARVLLGGVSNEQLYELKITPKRTLDTDMLTRISYVVGIFQALNILYSKTLADAWMQCPNANRIFAGRTPLEYIMKGGLPAMQIVRRLLDARRGGM